MKEKIKLYIISGFLGSGKTTFLRRMLTQYSEEKVGVIINEFGTIGIDGQTINRNGIAYVEVNNGSIFCSCIKANFTKTLIHLQKEDIDYLIIENSGLADPSTMNSLLGEMDRFMDRGYDYQGSICLVDADSFLDYVDMLPPLENQVLSSDFIIVNKADIAKRSRIDETKTRIGRINDNAFIIETTYADIPMEILDRKLYNSGFDGDTCNTPWNRPATYTLKIDRIYKKDAIERFALGLCDCALRIKGFVQTECGWVHIDGVGEHIDLRNVCDDADALFSKQGICIIGKDSTSFEGTITQLWRTLMQEDPVYLD